MCISKKLEYHKLPFFPRWFDKAIFRKTKMEAKFSHDTTWNENTTPFGGGKEKPSFNHLPSLSRNIDHSQSSVFKKIMSISCKTAMEPRLVRFPGNKTMTLGSTEERLTCPLMNLLIILLWGKAEGWGGHDFSQLSTWQRVIIKYNELGKEFVQLVDDQGLNMQPSSLERGRMMHFASSLPFHHEILFFPHSVWSLIYS